MFVIIDFLNFFLVSSKQERGTKINLRVPIIIIFIRESGKRNNNKCVLNVLNREYIIRFVMSVRNVKKHRA